ncbi:hypothetical protein PG911_16740 [Tenacibaculum ovolyticum]|uniref:M56 family metallopeptidase n=1 Tax=Tenacibaculum ovolyticum TaxID=104270 RepID=UPI0022F3CD16|nr:M56 family metallopeptidase [Tenacibaculum ovolyticum]WBX76251.1 hypothetical protein PG911_16740 [Tenacibaculum ovolyticum]
MVAYFLKSGVCLALLLFFYHLVLEREKMHHFNRFYLLGSMLFSFLAPLFIIYTKVPLEIIDTVQTTVTNAFVYEAVTTVETPINYWSYFIYLSIFISSILLIRFIKNIVSIYKKTKKNPILKHKKATLVLVDDAINPHTFWNYIFINKEAYYAQKIEEELFTHELTHASQKHTFDVLLVEFLKIIFWFNPIFYFLKKTIQLNHEFLADTKVIANHKNISEYQYLLLNKTAWNNEYYLASNLNYLLTKKRLLMMTKQSSRTKVAIKKLAVIPVLVVTIFLFANRIEANETTKKIVENTTDEKTKISLLENKYVISKKDSLIPLPPKTGFHEKKGSTLYYVKNKKGTTYYNKHGQIVTKSGKILNAKQTKSDKVIPNQNISKVYKDNKVVASFKENNILPPPGANFPVVKKSDISNIPPPPSPMVKKGVKSNIPPPPHAVCAFDLVSKYPNATYYYNDKKVGYKKILRIAEKEKELSVLTQLNTNKEVIKLTSKSYKK